jgi:hypothetical protein
MKESKEGVPMSSVETATIRIPVEIKWEPAWLSWVGATTSCLKALGVNCDLIDVAGMSGYAFTLCINETLCPSGPTGFHWGMLLPGVHHLGRTTLEFRSDQCHTGEFICDETRDACRTAYDIASREISEGRPCVIWGAYVPEFAVVTGVDDGKFIVSTFKECLGEEQPPIPYDGLEAPGGVYLLAFPGKTTINPLWADFHAINNAVFLLTARSVHPAYSFGIDAYDRWIKALEDDRADSFGNAYNSQCYAEGRALAHEFIKRIAARREFVAKPLGKAADAYGDAAAAVKKVAELFPFPPKDEVRDEKTRKEAIKALKSAKKAEKKALEELEEALEIEWPKQ